MGLAFWRANQAVAQTARAGRGADKEQEGAEQEAQLRRRTRHRLIGATILLLAAVVIVPMILNTDPRVVPDNVQITMPSAASVPASPATAQAQGADKPVAIAPESPRSESQAGERNAADGKGTEPKAGDAGKTTDAAKKSEPPKPAEPAKAAEAPKAVQKGADSKPAETGVTAEKAAAAAVAQDGKAPGATEDPIAALLAQQPTAGGRFALQAAALSSEKAARELASRLKQAGFKSYVEPVKTTAGMAHRVRVGPFDSKASADKAREAMRAAGFVAVVVDA